MFYWIFRWLFIIILKAFFRFKVEGAENLPGKTNFIIAANHFSFLDTMVIGAAIPRRTYWIASRAMYQLPWLNWFFRLIKALPSGSASEKVVALLTENKNVGLFPEGHVSYDGKLRDFRRGVALLALKTGRPIVPCAILGAYEALPRTRIFPRFSQIKVRIGKPIYLLKEYGDVVEDLFLQEGTFKVRKNIEEMLYAR